MLIFQFNFSFFHSNVLKFQRYCHLFFGEIFAIFLAEHFKVFGFNLIDKLAVLSYCCRTISLCFFYLWTIIVTFAHHFTITFVSCSFCDISSFNICWCLLLCADTIDVEKQVMNVQSRIFWLCKPNTSGSIPLGQGRLASSRQYGNALLWSSPIKKKEEAWNLNYVTIKYENIARNTNSNSTDYNFVGYWLPSAMLSKVSLRLY